MNFRPSDINTYLKKPDLSIKCALIYGTNEGMIADLSRQFAKAVCPNLSDAFRVAWLEMEAIEKDEGLLFGEYNAQSLLGGRRVVIVKEGNNNLTESLKKLFKNNSSDTLLVISSTSLNKKSSLVTLAANDPCFALVACYEDREEDISSFVRNWLVQKGITIAPPAMQLLCARLSPDRKISMGELEKLAVYLDSRHNIEFEDVSTLISDASGTKIDDFVFDVAEGQTAKALSAYYELLNEGNEVVMLTRSLANHFLRLLDSAEKVEKGMSARDVFKSQRPPMVFFKEASFIRQLNTWKRSAILDVLEILYQTERDCKTTNMPAEEILSHTIMRIAGAAKKMHR